MFWECSINRMRGKPHNIGQARRQRKILSWRLIVIGFLIGGTAGYFLSKVPIGSVPFFGNSSFDQIQQAQFSICNSASRITCVVDGDTIWLRSEKIRIADIDTPEISRPRCASEEALGHRAKHRLQALLNEGPFQVVRSGSRDKDKYGRLLRVIERDGRSLGDILVSEGLARRWDGRKRSWC